MGAPAGVRVGPYLNLNLWRRPESDSSELNFDVFLIGWTSYLPDEQEAGCNGSPDGVVKL